MFLSLVKETAGACARPLRAWLSVVALCLVTTGSAHAYDLSRAYDSTADEVERGFVLGSVGLWAPDIGDWRQYHQLSLDFGAEFGFRFASIQAAHNLYIVGGFNFSPQLLRREAVPNASERSTNVMLGYGGIRYIPGQLCFGDGIGCPFVELRLGLVFESSDVPRIHEGPTASLTVLPGVGYRFSFGHVFQLGARFDFSYSEEDDVRGLGWLNATGFAGFGW
jgi:hypothetical protein